MSYQIELSNKFKKDYKLAMKRGLPESKLEEVLFHCSDMKANDLEVGSVGSHNTHITH